jgi:nicotinamidase-related amidase
MAAKNPDPHGNAPDKCPVALLVIDMINDMEFEGGEQLLKHAKPAAQCIADYKRRARAAGIPVIYVNDNLGRWRSDFREVVEYCSREDARGRVVAQLLHPEPEDYFVLKPKHSAFYGTTLEILLKYLTAHRLILTGVAADMCVLFTAADAYLRDFELNIPADCVASISAVENRRALSYMERVFKADIRPTTKLNMKTLIRPRTTSTARE